ncbi:hypothetical protein [Leptospira licerasiae]|uniref:hypothetical protein n=1 Tax=Leptospira licerasiae TaxID=447106 RepID=UPI00108395C8|nr:hypothetical protein [Leptospira licerasiae]TGM85584.1 hypothetical protein EHR05_18705 [Leptospira licerasiae]
MELQIKPLLKKVLIISFFLLNSSANSEQVSKHNCIISNKKNELIAFCNFKSGQYGFKLFPNKSFYYGSFRKRKPNGVGIMHRVILNPSHKHFGGFEILYGVWDGGRITNIYPNVETCVANNCQRIDSSIKIFNDEINSISKTCSGRMISKSELQGACHSSDNNYIQIGNFLLSTVRGEFVLVRFDELNSNYIEIQYGFIDKSGRETVYSKEQANLDFAEPK